MAAFSSNSEFISLWLFLQPADTILKWLYSTVEKHDLFLYTHWLLHSSNSYSEINVKGYRRCNQKWKTRETGNIWYTRRRQTNQKHNTICVGHHYAQANTNNVNKTWALLQTTGGKDKPNMIFIGKSKRKLQHVIGQHKTN